mgnify:FL=1
MKTLTRIVILLLSLTSLNCVSLNTAKEITSREIDHDITASIDCEKSGTKALCTVTRKEKVNIFSCTNEVCEKVK